jgi:hypothetical protein
MQAFNQYLQALNQYLQQLSVRVSQILPGASTASLEWLAIVILHSATLPSILAFMSGLSNDVLPIDLVLLLWTGLVIIFVKSAIERNTLNMITIGLGFAMQASLLALTFFR